RHAVEVGARIAHQFTRPLEFHRRVVPGLPALREILRAGCQGSLDRLRAVDGVERALGGLFGHAADVAEAVACVWYGLWRPIESRVRAEFPYAVAQHAVHVNDAMYDVFAGDGGLGRLGLAFRAHDSFSWTISRASRISCSTSLPGWRR